MSVNNNLYKATNKSRSIKTTVPQAVIMALGLTEKDTLLRTPKTRGGEIIAEVRKNPEAD